jgi:hypothetical protein
VLDLLWQEINQGDSTSVFMESRKSDELQNYVVAVERILVKFPQQIERVIKKIKVGLFALSPSLYDDNPKAPFRPIVSYPMSKEPFLNEEEDLTACRWNWGQPNPYVLLLLRKIFVLSADLSSIEEILHSAVSSISKQPAHIQLLQYHYTNRSSCLV